MHGVREREVGRGSSTLSGPLKYGGSAAFSWSFADKERRTPYILRRHCINACYSCNAFVELHPPFLVSLSLSSHSYCPSRSLVPFLFLSLSLCHSLCFSCTPASYVSTDVQFISYVTSSTYVYIRRNKKTWIPPFHLQAGGQTTTCT